MNYDKLNSLIGKFLGEEPREYHKLCLTELLDIVEEEYFYLLKNIGLGIFEFVLYKYPSERDSAEQGYLDFPDGYLIITDERCSDFEDQRTEAVYRGVVEYVKFKYAQDCKWIKM